MDCVTNDSDIAVSFWCRVVSPSHCTLDASTRDGLKDEPKTHPPIGHIPKLSNAGGRQRTLSAVSSYGRPWGVAVFDLCVFERNIVHQSGFTGMPCFTLRSQFVGIDPRGM